MRLLDEESEEEIDSEEIEQDEKLRQNEEILAQELDMLANDASLFEDLQRFKRKTVNKEVDVQSSLLVYAN